MIVNPQSSITITVWNANGIRRQIIDSILKHTSHSSLLFNTETFLLPPNSFPTHWPQYHVYGKRSENARVGHMGISLLINPDFLYKDQIVFLQNLTDSPFYHYSLSCRIDTLLIHCLYLHPSLPNNIAIEVLESLPLSLPHTTNTIFCGDFNTRIKDIVGDHAANDCGTPFFNWITTNGLTIHNKELAYGEYTFKKNGACSIIDYFISSRQLQQPILSIETDLSLSSDHHMLHLSFNPEFTATPSPATLHPRRLWKLSQFADDKKRTTYQQIFKEKAGPLLQELQQAEEQDEKPDLDHLYGSLCDIIYNALDHSVGPSTPPPRSAKWFWTVTLQEAIDHREHCY